MEHVSGIVARVLDRALVLRALDNINRVLVDALANEGCDAEKQADVNVSVRLAVACEQAYELGDFELVATICKQIEAFRLDAPKPDALRFESTYDRVVRELRERGIDIIFPVPHTRFAFGVVPPIPTSSDTSGETALPETVECNECCGDGFVVNQYEPIPGIDHQMGESVRVREKCRVCKGTGQVVS